MPRISRHIERGRRDGRRTRRGEGRGVKGEGGEGRERVKRKKKKYGGKTVTKEKEREQENSRCLHERIREGDSLTINVPVVYMVRYKVVLRGDYP
jgi:hypothetical protein